MIIRAIASKRQSLLNQFSQRELMRFFHYGIALIVFAAALGSTLLLHGLLQDTPAALFYVAVMMSSWFGGFGPGLLTALLSAIALKYFFLEPFYSLDLDSLKSTFQSAVFVTTALLICSLNESRLSAKRRADANLKSWRESEAQFAHLAEANIIGIFAANLNGLITEANDAFLKMVGYTKEDLWAGKIHWNEMTPPEYEQVSQRSQQELRTQGVCTPFEKAYLRKDGSPVPVLVGSVMQGQRVIGFVLDLSESKRNEAERQRTSAALRDSEERYRYLADSIPQQVWIATSAGEMLDVNQRWLEYTGLTMEQVQTQGWQAVVYPDDVPVLTERWLVAVQSGQPYQAEGRQRRADGIYRWYLHQAIPQKNERGEIVKWYGTATDIHDRKQAQLNEQFLNHLDRQLRQLVDAQEMLWETVSCLGEYLQGNRCIFSEIQAPLGLIKIGRDWCQEVPSIAGTYAISNFITPEFQASLVAGQTVAVNDVTADIRTSKLASRYGLLQINAFVTIPYIYQGQWVAALSIHAKLPREWREDEITLLQETLARLWPLIEQTRAVQALRESEARYRVLTELSPQIVFMSRPDGYITYCNQWGLEFTGRTLAELQGYGWAECIHPEDRDRIFGSWMTVIQKATDYEIEIPFRRADGVYRWLYSRALPVTDETGQVAYWLGVALDISDRKQAELEREQLLERERYYINQLQGLTTAALEINAAPSLEQILQATTDQAVAIIGTHQAVTILAIDQNWDQAVCTFYLSDKYAQWRDYNEKPTGSGIYACVCHLNRSVRMTQAELEAHPQWQGFGKEAVRHPPMRGWLAAPLTGRDGKNIGLIQLSDKYEGEFTAADEAILVQLAQMASVVIEKARLYEAEQQARTVAEASREAAEAANRIRDEFLAVLSHELRSPLNPILGWTKLLQSRQFTPEKTAQALETIERNAKLQAQLIEDLLDVSRILQGKMMLNICSVDLVTTIESAIETVRLAAEAKNIQIRTRLDVTGVTVAGDPNRLQQVVWNLLSNAVKFTPSGGQIEVGLSLVTDPAPTMRNGVSEESVNWLAGAREQNLEDSASGLRRQRKEISYAQITVSDNGKGISPEFLPYVFDYFRQEDGTTTRKFGGLGLGLAIVRHLTEQHGGTVAVESAGDGQGATFMIRLPLQSLPVATTAQPSPTQSFDLSQLKILIVDDEMDMRDLVLFALESQGATVKSASSATEALNILEEWLPDILISDIGMPNMDGYMLMRKVRSLPADQGGMIPAIALTAYAGEIDQKQAIAVGFQRHLAKPVEPAQLVEAIASLDLAQPEDARPIQV